MKNKNIKIVVIEDILDLLEYHLSKEGHEVTGFLSVENVAYFLEEENPARMIVDRNLPSLEGSECVAQMREIGYEMPLSF